MSQVVQKLLRDKSIKKTEQQLAEEQKAKQDIKSVLGIDDNSSNNDDIHRLVSELINDNNIEGKTDLNSNQIVAVARASWYAERYDSENLRIIIRYILKYLQSKDRKGRLELKEAITGMFRYELEKSKSEKVEI